MSAAQVARGIQAVCPCCRGDLATDANRGKRCSGCGAHFPRRANVDVFFTEDEWHASLAHLEEEKDALKQYRQARRESPLNILYYDYWVARMLRQVPLPCQDRILELMCGEAEICRRLPEACRAALALDYNVQMGESAASQLRAAGENRVQVLCGTAARLPVADASVGAVLIQGGLHHARPFLKEILAEIRRVLRPEGVLVASEPANDHFLTRAIRRWQYSHSALQGHDPGEDGFTRRQVAEALSSCGLRLNSYRIFGYLAYPLLGNTDLLPLLRKLRWRAPGYALLALDWLLERVPLVRGTGWASIFTAAKA